MMAYVDAEGLDSVISWVLNGRGFHIHDPDKLVDILPLFFGHTKYRSFRRQLNMWHFERILEGPNKGTFIHPYFVKENKSLCSYMSRQIFTKHHTKDEDLTVKDDTKPKRTRTPSLMKNQHVLSQTSLDLEPDEFQSWLLSTDTMHRGKDGIDTQNELTLPSFEMFGDNIAVPTSALSSKRSHMDRKNETHFSLEDVCSSWLDCQNESPLPPQPDNTQSQYLSRAPISAANLIAMADGSSYPTASDLVGDDLGLFAGKQFFVVDINNNSSS
jgi:hypothetical protein